MEKVKLPLHVAEAIDFLQREGWTKDGIVWGVTNERHIKSGDKKLRVLFDFAIGGDNVLKVADALRYGYEIEPEPITVTITQEMQDELRKVYNDCPFNEKVGFRSALTVLDLKIPGVNA